MHFEQGESHRNGAVEGIYSTEDVKKFQDVGAALGVDVKVLAKAGESYRPEPGTICIVRKGEVLLQINRIGKDKDLAAFWNQVRS